MLAMPLHLLKLAVGIDDVDQLRRIRATRAAERGGSWVYTRNRPRRAVEVLAGGSIYWIIRGHIRVRQLVSGFRSERDVIVLSFSVIELFHRDDVDAGAVFHDDALRVLCWGSCRCGEIRRWRQLYPDPLVGPFHSGL